MLKVPPGSGIQHVWNGQEISIGLYSKWMKHRCGQKVGCIICRFGLEVDAPYIGVSKKYLMYIDVDRKWIHHLGVTRKCVTYICTGSKCSKYECV